MKRTVSIKLNPTDEQATALEQTRLSFARVCNQIVPFAAEKRCFNNVALHHLAYYSVRADNQLGSQMVCQAVRSVAAAYKALKLKKSGEVPTIFFNGTSTPYDKRTYRIHDNQVSLYTVTGRVLVDMVPGEFQTEWLDQGLPKEAKLIQRKEQWFFNLVLDVDDPELIHSDKVLGVDLGENNIAATSTGQLFGGGELRHERDQFLNLRKRLQANGSKSAKQLLKKASGREHRHVQQVNHEVSKAIVAEAIDSGCGVIAMENLTNIRKRIKAGKRIRTRLHRWAWAELQTFVEYKAQAAGLKVVYVDPAYSSQTCSQCGAIAQRVKHSLSCKTCGSRQHSDLNASQNICQLGATAVASTGGVAHPNVASLVA